MNTSLIKDGIVPREQSHVRSIAWSPETAGVLAVGSDDGMICIMDLVNGVAHRLFSTHTPVHALAWSPDGTSIAAAGAEHTVEICSVATGVKRLRYYGHQAGVYRRLTARVHALAWSIDGQRIVSGSSDGTVQLWDASTGIHVETLVISAEGVCALAWSPEMTSIASASCNTIDGLDVETGRCCFSTHVSTRHITVLVWSPVGKHIMCGTADGSVYVWDVASGTPAAPVTRCEGAVKAANWGPDGILHFAYVGLDRAVHQREIPL